MLQCRHRKQPDHLLLRFHQDKISCFRKYSLIFSDKNLYVPCRENFVGVLKTRQDKNLENQDSTETLSTSKTIIKAYV